MKKTTIITMLILTIFSCSKKKEIVVVKQLSDTIVIQKTKKSVRKKKPKRLASDSLNLKNTVAYFSAYGKKNKETKVLFKTRLGDITIRLYNNTPLHRANFIFLTKNGYFSSTCFHRIVPYFIAQGGNSEFQKTIDFRNKYQHYELPPEFRKNRKHKRGTIAAARDWEDNPKKMSTPFEFYFIVNPKGEHHLDNEHTVFGEVIKGMDVIDKITKIESDEDQWPYHDVFIKASVLD